MVPNPAEGQRVRTRIAWALLAAVVLGLSAWRVSLVLSGPDADSDAYGHHMIARQILVEPGDLGVHWVWLPLFHYLQVPLVWAGATMNTVRFINVALWALVPLVLFAWLRRAPARQTDARPTADDADVRLLTALGAALLCALSPIGMQMGTTAQPEPLFCLTVLGFVIMMERGAHVRAALLLGAATMLRYEAWAILPVVALCNLFGGRATAREARWRRWLPLALPVVLILAWAIARRPYDGKWFGFLTGTREFANDAMKTKSSLDGGFAQLATDLTFYAARVPWRVMGPAVLLAPIGLLRTARARGVLFMLAYLACLGFLTLTWIMRSSLGLDRHFVVMLPFYATLAANGAAALAAFGARLEVKGARVLAGSLATLVFVGALAATGVRLQSWMHEWRGALENAWPDRVAMGGYLRTLPERDVIFCDEATVEILSGLDRRRFDRHWVDEPSELARVHEAADRDGEAYVATWMAKLTTLRGEGELLYRPPGETADDAGLAVLKITRSAPR